MICAGNRYWLRCDTCGRTSDERPTIPEALTAARDEGWEEGLSEDMNDYATCPGCLRADKQRQCGLREGGHVWRRMYGPDVTASRTVGDGEWLPLGHGRYVRTCKNCGFHDVFNPEKKAAS